MIDGFETTNVWEAAVFTYLYGFECLTKIEDFENNGSRKRTTTYSLAVPSQDPLIIIADYGAGRLPLGDAKAFVAAFNNITSTQNSMRQRREASWCSKRWINGEVR